MKQPRVVSAGILIAAGALALAAGAHADGDRHRGDEIRDQRYCEILPSVVEGETVTTFVYNTFGLNDCPAEQWDALTEEQVNEAYGSQDVLLNGPRFWTIDHVTGQGESDTGQTFTFGGIEMSLRATITTPAGEPIGGGPYTVNRIERETVYSFDRGKLMYKLTDPDGNVYAMQAYSQIVAPKLNLRKLRHLGRRLRLPEGWTYSTRRLRHPMTLTADGVAHVVQDNLANTYQRMAKPKTTISGAPSGCVEGKAELTVRVEGDTALTRVLAGGSLVASTTDDEITVGLSAKQLRDDQRVVASSRNDAGVSRDHVRLRACG